MKIMKKGKNIILSIAITLSTIPTKIFAVADPNSIWSKPVTMYGVEPVRNYSSLMSILKLFVIPIIVLIGIIAYCLKSKSSKKKKILISLLLTLIGIILILLIDYLF